MKLKYEFDSPEELRKAMKNLSDYHDCEKCHGKIVCFTMPKGTLITRLDGKVAFTGNCWWMNYMANGWAENIWLLQGGKETRDSYEAHGYHYLKLPKSHRDFFNNGVYYYELDDMLFVHGGFDYPVLPKDSNVEDLMWDRELIVRMRCGLKVKEWKKIFVGHTSTENVDAKPFVIDWHEGNFAKLIQVDCGAGWNGRLCLYNIDTDEYFLSDFNNKLYPKNN